MTICPKCKLEVPSDYFYYKADRPDKKSWSCKACSSTYAMDWYRNNRKKAIERSRLQKIQKRYKITLEEYNKIIEKSNDICALCGRHQNDLQYKLCLDHDHKTGKVRGMLCHKCNRGIGLLQDSPEVCLSAYNYLKSGGY